MKTGGGERGERGSMHVDRKEVDMREQTRREGWKTKVEKEENK